MNTLRRFSRRAPVLHGYLMAMLILMPAPLPQVQAEEYPPEEVWSYVRSESAVTITLSAPEGTTELPPQGQRTVAVLLESTSWQVWESNLGGSENREESTQPTSGTVTLAVVSGGGTLSASEVTTDVQGLASATFVMGGHMTNMVTATHGGTVATLEFQPGPEEWTYSHPEESLYALIEPVGTVASPLPAGQSCQTRVRARHDTWDVYTSNWGGLDTRGHVSTPAGGAAFVWTVEGGGDGVLSGTLSGQLDEQGEGVVDFTMGALDTRVRVDVDYAGSGVTYATYEFSSGVAWSYDHSEGFVSATLSAPGGTTNVPAGTWRAAHVDVIYTGWEVWTDGQGGTQIRNHLAGPAVNAPVSLSVPGGTCGLSASAGNADANGRWSFEFNMNENPSSLLAQVSYA
ncbi:MAG: hypothetical protein JNG86_09645, partial [Verrucomicrobiaceae bacterium]|nr:hypothetical protein [Verrucomicrobiaceae bacterium]